TQLGEDARERLEVRAVEARDDVDVVRHPRDAVQVHRDAADDAVADVGSGEHLDELADEHLYTLAAGLSPLTRVAMDEASPPRASRPRGARAQEPPELDDEPPELDDDEVEPDEPPFEGG